MSRQEIETALALLSRASDAELKGLQNTDAFIDARRKISRCTRSAQSDDLPQQLLDAILDSLDDIKAYVAKSPKETVGEPSYLKEDFRITDYRSATGKRTTDLTSKFRAHLGARSYAQDVISWEIRKYHTSRVDELVDDLSQSQDKTSGHITEFLGVSKCPRIAKNITGYGIKILVLERLYRSVGLSIVLAAHYWKLSRLRYGQFEVFLRLLRAKTDICRFIDCTGEYIEECQTYYDRTGAHWEPQIEKSLDDYHDCLASQLDNGSLPRSKRRRINKSQESLEKNGTITVSSVASTSPQRSQSGSNSGERSPSIPSESTSAGVNTRVHLTQSASSITINEGLRAVVGTVADQLSSHYSPHLNNATGNEESPDSQAVSSFNQQRTLSTESSYAGVSDPMRLLSSAVNHVEHNSSNHKSHRTDSASNSAQDTLLAMTRGRDKDSVSPVRPAAMIIRSNSQAQWQPHLPAAELNRLRYDFNPNTKRCGADPIPSPVIHLNSSFDSNGPSAIGQPWQDGQGAAPLESLPSIRRQLMGAAYRQAFNSTNSYPQTSTQESANAMIVPPLSYTVSKGHDASNWNTANLRLENYTSGRFDVDTDIMGMIGEPQTIYGTLNSSAANPNLADYNTLGRFDVDTDIMAIMGEHQTVYTTPNSSATNPSLADYSRLERFDTDIDVMNILGNKTLNSGQGNQTWTS